MRTWIANYEVVSLIGLCKNAGKTTTLCRLLSELSDTPLGLTSVGRDGEGTDLVTGTEKPSIWVREGTLFATAVGMLAYCDTTLSVEALTNVSSPLGNIAVFRALSDGFVQLAGPSIVSQLDPLCELFTSLGARRVLVDGAAGRKSLAALERPCCTILCTGASLSPAMETTVAETVHICGLFSSPTAQNAALRGALETVTQRSALFTPEGEPLPLPLEEDGRPNLAKLPRERCVLWIDGGITSSFVKQLYQRRAPLTLAVPDATHFLCDRTVTEKFFQQGGDLLVTKEIPVAGVTANPFSAYGHHYDRDAFLDALRRRLSIPVLDVKEEVSVCS